MFVLLAASTLGMLAIWKCKRFSWQWYRSGISGALKQNFYSYFWEKLEEEDSWSLGNLSAISTYKALGVCFVLADLVSMARKNKQVCSKKPEPSPENTVETTVDAMMEAAAGLLSAEVCTSGTWHLPNTWLSLITSLLWIGKLRRQSGRLSRACFKNRVEQYLSKYGLVSKCSLANLSGPGSVLHHWVWNAVWAFAKQHCLVLWRLSWLSLLIWLQIWNTALQFRRPHRGRETVLGSEVCLCPWTDSADS